MAMCSWLFGSYIVFPWLICPWYSLYGTNVKKYKKTSDGKVRVIIPDFSEMAIIRDDLLLENTFQPLTCLTSFIGFTTLKEKTELWLNLGIDIKLTPAICYINE